MLNPICFSIPEEKIVSSIPMKTKMLSHIIPVLNVKNYIYDNETDYYNEYRKSMFAVTRKKAGWDCMRHYEIIANGCIPYFVDIENCPEKTMTLWPKNLLVEGNSLFHHLRNKNINELTETDLYTYNNLVNRLLDYTKKYLTTNKIAKYILEKTNNLGVARILFLCASTHSDYLRSLTLHGFKEIMGANCHDHLKLSHIYKSDKTIFQDLYGRGMTYTNLLENKLRNDNLDNTIEEDIKNKYYDIVIYGLAGDADQPGGYYDLVSRIYAPNKIILLCGGDDPDWMLRGVYDKWLNKGHYVFVRELTDR